jgi:hypothetical protein
MEVGATRAGTHERHNSEPTQLTSTVNDNVALRYYETDGKHHKLIR